MNTRSKTLNMTEGGPVRLLILFAIPMLIGNLFQQVYNLADSIIVGRMLGSGALAAVGATGSVSFLFFSVCNGMSTGGGIVTSQYFGAGDDEKVRKAIAGSAYLLLSSALIMGLVSFFLAPQVLRLMGTPSDILPDAVTYMRMACISVPLIAVYNYSASMLRALGDSRTPLYFLVLACLLNILLDLLFVGPLKLGVFGAALATSISQFAAGVSCLFYAVRYNPYFHLQKEHFAFDREISLQTIRIGIPLALQWALIAISGTAMQTAVNSFGTTAVAAFTATNRIENLIHMPFGSFGQALATFAGQNYGAGRNDRVRSSFRQGTLLMAGLSIFLFVFMQLLGSQTVRAFVQDSEVIVLGTEGLRLTSWFYFALSMIYISRGIQNGVGDGWFAFINGIVEVICRIGLPGLLMLLPGADAHIIWWACGITWVISGAFCLIRYFTWQRRHGAGNGSMLQRQHRRRFSLA